METTVVTTIVSHLVPDLSNAFTLFGAGLFGLIFGSAWLASR